MSLSQASSHTIVSEKESPMRAGELPRTGSRTGDKDMKKRAFWAPPVHHQDIMPLENNLATPAADSAPANVHMQIALAEEGGTYRPIYRVSRRQSTARRGTTAQSLRRSGGRRTLTHKGSFRSVKAFSIVALLFVVVRQALRMYSVCMTSGDKPRGLTDGRDGRWAAGSARRLAGIGGADRTTKHEACMREVYESLESGNKEAALAPRRHVSRPTPAGAEITGVHHAQSAEEQQHHQQKESPATTPQEKQEGVQLLAGPGARVAEQQQQGQEGGTQQGSQVSGSRSRALLMPSVNEPSAAELYSSLSVEGSSLSTPSPTVACSETESLLLSRSSDSASLRRANAIRRRGAPGVANITQDHHVQRAEEQQQHQQKESPATAPQKKEEGLHWLAGPGAVVAEQRQQGRAEDTQQRSGRHPAVLRPPLVHKPSATAESFSSPSQTGSSLPMSNAPVRPSQTESNLCPSPTDKRTRSPFLGITQKYRALAAAGKTGAYQPQRAEEQQQHQQHQQTKSAVATSQKGGGPQLLRGSGSLAPEQQQQAREEGTQSGTQVSGSHPTTLPLLPVNAPSTSPELFLQLALEQLNISTPTSRVTPFQTESGPSPLEKKSSAGLRLRGNENVASHPHRTGTPLRRSQTNEEPLEQMLQEGISLGELTILKTSHTGGGTSSTPQRSSAGNSPEQPAMPSWRIPTHSVPNVSATSPGRSGRNPLVARLERFSRQKRLPTPATLHASPPSGDSTPPPTPAALHASPPSGDSTPPPTPAALHASPSSGDSTLTFLPTPAALHPSSSAGDRTPLHPSSPAALHASSSSDSWTPLHRAIQSLGSLDATTGGEMEYLIPVCSTLPRQRSGIQWVPAQEMTTSAPSLPTHDVPPCSSIGKGGGRRSTVGSRPVSSRHVSGRLTPFNLLSRASTLATIYEFAEQRTADTGTSTLPEDGNTT